MILVRSVPRVLLIVTAAVLIGAAAAGCATGQSAHTHRDVATLKTHSSEPIPSASVNPLFAKYGTPPQLRLDMTDDEVNHSMDPFNACLSDHGMATKAEGASKAVTTQTAKDPEAVMQLCSQLRPKPPWELDVRNPKALKFAQANVDCLKKKGVTQVELVPNDGTGQVAILLGGPGNDQRSIDLGGKYLEVCQQVASAATK